MNTTSENAGNGGGAARDPSQLERESSEIRADMDRTLDALERKFSPGMVLDRSLEYLREHGGDVTRRVSDSVRNNPVPVMMTVAGIVWLIGSGIRSRSRQDLGAVVHEEEYEHEHEHEPERADASGGNGSGRGRAGALHRVRQRARSIGARVRDRVHDRVEATREHIRSSREASANTVSGRLSDAMYATRERTRRMQGRMHTIVDEQPLLVGALAVAVGAVIGAVLPVTEYENRAMGPLRDRALAKARQAGEHQYDTLRSKLSTREDVQVSGSRTN
jgi:ElaB/YqjD/DUF883 family membrane-anchored ribosome-binding protein